MNWNDTVTTSLVPVPEMPEPAVLALKPAPPPVYAAPFSAREGGQIIGADHQTAAHAEVR